MPDAPEMPAVPGSVKTWDEGIQAVRGRTTWFVGALAVIAVALFGATAIVVRPELSWEDDFWRLTVAGILGTVAVGGALVIAWAAANTYLPVQVTLDKLPKTLTARIKKHPGRYLPDGVTLSALGTRFDEARTAAFAANDELLEASANLKASPADQTLKDGVTAAKRKFEEARAKERVLNVAVRAILDEARYEAVLEQRKMRWWVLVVGIAVAAAGIWYQLVLATTPPPDSEDASSGGTAVAVLARDTANDANNRLWTTLGLDACKLARPQTPDGILVAVSSGSGTPEDPYTVTTLPQTAATAGCPAVSFNTIDDVARVVITKPSKVPITYTPNPSPSPT